MSEKQKTSARAMPSPDSIADRTRSVSMTGALAMLKSDSSTNRSGSKAASQSAGHSAARAPDSRGMRLLEARPPRRTSRSELRK